LIKPDKVPSNYATTVEKDGKQVVVFGSGPIAFEPKLYDQILSGYGLPSGVGITLTFPDKVPSNYATTVEKDGKKVVVFGSGPIAFEPKLYDQILSGYSLTLRDPSKVPSNYATTVEKDGKTQIVFATSHIAYEPKLLHQILSGYSY
jgi:hypothetical protein